MTLIEELKQEAPQATGEEFHSMAERVNVGEVERTASAILGGAVTAYGLSRKSLGGLALAVLGGGLIRRGLTGHCDAYSALGMNTADENGAPPEDYFQSGIHVRQSFTIAKPAAELFRYWRNFENLPKFMTHLQSVKVIDNTRSHWITKGPAGTSVEWDAEIINEEPDALIAWRSLGRADVDNAGSVRFIPAPGDRGTEVHVTVDYIPPAGRLGAAVAWLFGRSAQQQIQEDLRRFKWVMETGVIPTTEGQPMGTCSNKM